MKTLTTMKKVLAGVLAMLIVASYAVPSGKFLTESKAIIANAGERTPVESGDCNESIHWALYDDGTLEITGEGDMPNYSEDDYAPWYGKDVKNVIIESGVTSIGNYAFYECYNLISITLPDGVESIGNYAFYECYNLISITLPDGVESIGDYAFCNCTSLTSIDIPDSVTSIGKVAFGCCYGLTSIIIPDGVESIEDNTFGSCVYLSDITIPNSVQSIGNDAFVACYALTSITLPEGVKSIGNEAFCNCTSLTSITLPEGVESIGEGTFKGCYALTGITLPDGVKSIGNHAFENCFSLTSITLPDGVESIGDYAFDCCYALTSITLLEGVESIGEKAFDCCYSLTSITIPDGVKSIGKYAFNNCESLTSITIPEGVESIGDYAFYGCESLTSITLPDGITNIGDYAFYDCESLTSITLPDGVKSIGEKAFENCYSLTSITLPDGVESIGNNAFNNCESLTSITLPDSVTSIGKDAFNTCESLTSITIPDSVTSIGEKAFYNCYSLTSITLPDSVESIGDEAFYRCKSLNSITIPDSVTSIGKDAFKYCYSLHNVQIPENFSKDIFYTYIIELPCEENKMSDSCGENVIFTLDEYGVLTISGNGEMANYSDDSKAPWYDKFVSKVIIESGVTSIGNYAFRGCDSLESIDIPDSVTSIGDDAFYNCYSLKSITIPDGVESIGESAFDFCFALTSITIPDSVTSIGDCAFEYCNALTSITLPEGVESIGADAFDCCYALTSINIPKGVTSIGVDAFYCCYALNSVTIPDSVTSIGASAFDCCYALNSVTIPDSVTSIGADAFDCCYALTSINIPDSITCIEEGTFWDCHLLNSIIFPDNLENIGENAFRECFALTSITIPDSVTSIGADAFYGCYSLADVGCYADPENLSWNENECDDFMKKGLTKIHVPNEYLKEYKFKFMGEVNTIFVSIEDLSVITAPVGKNLASNGKEQELIQAGSAENGTMKYYVGNEPPSHKKDWSIEIPKAKKNGTYKIWYKVFGNVGYTDTEENFVTATISAQSIQNFTVRMDSYTYDGTAHQPQIIGEVYGDIHYYYYTADKNGNILQKLSEPPTEVGNYVAEVFAYATDIYQYRIVKVPYSIREAVNYHLSVKNGTVNGETSGEFIENSIITVKADKPATGKKFGYWTKNGSAEAISYNTSYTFKINSDTQLEAIYLDADDEFKVDGRCMKDSVDIDKKNKKISFSFLNNVPKNCTMVKCGVVATSDLNQANSLSLDNAMYVKEYETDAYNCKYTWTKSNVTDGQAWYVKGYLIYKDKSGKETTVYSHTEKATLKGSQTILEEKILGTASMASVKSYKNTDTSKGTCIDFVSLLNVPADCKIKFAGVVATSDENKKENLTKINATERTDIDNCFVRGTASSKHTVQFTWTKTNVGKETWYVRPYLVYTDSLGREQTVYGELTTKKLS